MAARFEKEELFDGFDAKVSYQMVPLSGERPMTVVSDADECIITVDQEDIVSMHNFRFDKGVPNMPGDFEVSLTPNNRVSFSIIGKRPGNTTIFLKKKNGQFVGNLSISVKSVVAKTYALCRLSDRRRSCPFTTIEINNLMPRVAQTYIQQANVQLNDNAPGKIFEINCPDDLGDPLLPDKQSVSNAIRAKVTDVESSLPIGSRFLIGSSNFIIYFAWNISDTRGDKGVVGLNFGQECYVEQLSDAFQNALNVAHELGHGLGLTHTGAKLMMNASADRSSKLQQHEIDTINQTDIAP
jgi:hypothetical protein